MGYNEYNGQKGIIKQDEERTVDLRNEREEGEVYMKRGGYRKLA